MRRGIENDIRIVRLLDLQPKNFLAFEYRHKENLIHSVSVSQ